MRESDNQEIAVDLLLNAARELRATVADAPPPLAGSLLNSEVLAGIDDGVVSARATRDLPSRVIAKLLDDTPVLIGYLESAPSIDGHFDTLRRHRNQAAIARSWLGLSAQNLQLFLLGPLGSARIDAWQDVAECIEADDRVCRKLVWLPTTAPTLDEAKEFLRRTFLARPWVDRTVDRAPRLDQMSAITLPPQWAEILEDASLESDEIVARIIEVTE